MLLKYYHIVKTLIDNFKCFKMYYIPRESNIRANLLSKLASTKKVGHLKTIIQETIQAPTINAEEVMAREEEEPDWMTPYKNILIRGTLPPNEDKAQRLKRNRVTSTWP